MSMTLILAERPVLLVIRYDHQVRKFERFSAILEQLASKGSASVEELSKRLDVSGATIRRDLNQLAEQRLLTRTHGGAVVQAISYELPVRYRTEHHSEQKRRIAAAAAELVPDGGVIGITGGTTTTEAARVLASRQNLTVVTNALNIAAELAVRPNLSLIVTGGMARAASFELVGPVAEQTLAGYHLDVALLGVDGIEAGAGCTTHDDIEARTNAALIGRARRTVVLADGTKLGRVAFATICALSAVNLLITDGGVDPAELAALQAEGLEVQIV
jgi:DeoR family transcriptional regulator, aga operon transcriptional repressor